MGESIHATLGRLREEGWKASLRVDDAELELRRAKKHQARVLEAIETLKPIARALAIGERASEDA